MQSLHQDFTISADFEESKRGERFEDIPILLLFRLYDNIQLSICYEALGQTIIFLET